MAGFPISQAQFSSSAITVLVFLLLLLLLFSEGGSKSYRTFINIVNLQVPTQNLRDFPLFHVSPSFKNCPCARCATVANSVYSDSDVFRRQIFHLDLTLHSILYLNELFKFAFLCFVCVRLVDPVYCSLCVLCCVVSVTGHLPAA